MKATTLPLLFAVFAIRASAEDAIPSELVGEWRSLRSNGIVYIRVDGFAAIEGGRPPLGAPFLATYDPKKFELTLSPRVPENTPHSPNKWPDVHFSYDPKALTIKYKELSMEPFTRRNQESPEWVKSFDLKKLVDPSK